MASTALQGDVDFASSGKLPGPATGGLYQRFTMERAEAVDQGFGHRLQWSLAMNMARRINPPAAGSLKAAREGMIDERPIAIGTQDRRMQVRAYNHWMSLLRGRPCPALADLDAAGLADFAPNSVLLDFSTESDNPAIRFLGAALAAQCGLTGIVRHLRDAPESSLLSRLAEPYAQIIANRAPIGFEAEFAGPRGSQMLYRGLLMPFADAQGRICGIHGVINWKEAVDIETQALLVAEIDASCRPASSPPPETARRGPPC